LVGIYPGIARRLTSTQTKVKSCFPGRKPAGLRRQRRRDGNTHAGNGGTAKRLTHLAGAVPGVIGQTTAKSSSPTAPSTGTCASPTSTPSTRRAGRRSGSITGWRGRSLSALRAVWCWGATPTSRRAGSATAAAPGSFGSTKAGGDSAAAARLSNPASQFGCGGGAQRIISSQTTGHRQPVLLLPSGQNLRHTHHEIFTP
jgi:hypothetical protein